MVRIKPIGSDRSKYLARATILKVDGKIFCQSDAMYEWAAKKANLIPEDPEKALAMRMVVGKLSMITYHLTSSFRIARIMSHNF